MFSTVTQEITRTIISVFCVRGASEALSHHHRGDKTTLGNARHLYESLVKCVCVGLGVFVHIGFTQLIMLHLRLAGKQVLGET